MGYFSNGSEGEDYQSRYCDRCYHDRNGDCPIWFMHLMFNYDDCEKKGSPLHYLIPRNPEGGNDECRLFVPRASVTEFAAQEE